jgi:hypothetical protein
VTRAEKSRVQASLAVTVWRQLSGSSRPCLAMEMTDPALSQPCEIDTGTHRYFWAHNPVQILPPQPRKQQLDQRVSCEAEATQSGGFLLCAHPVPISCPGRARQFSARCRNDRWAPCPDPDSWASDLTVSSLPDRCGRAHEASLLCPRSAASREQSRPGSVFNGRLPVVIEPAGVLRLSQSVPIATPARRSCGDGVGMRGAEAAVR